MSELVVTCADWLLSEGRRVAGGEVSGDRSRQSSPARDTDAHRAEDEECERSGLRNRTEFRPTHENRR